MENLVVDPGGIAPVDVTARAAVGFRISEPVRMVSALPVPGLELVPATVTQGVVQGETVPGSPFVPPAGFSDPFPVGRSGLPGGSVTVRAGQDQVYVSRLVWATPEH